MSVPDIEVSRKNWVCPDHVGVADQAHQWERHKGRRGDEVAGHSYGVEGRDWNEAPRNSDLSRTHTLLQNTSRSRIVVTQLLGQRLYVSRSVPCGWIGVRCTNKLSTKRSTPSFRVASKHITDPKRERVQIEMCSRFSSTHICWLSACSERAW